jgi:hypothetical protein
MSHDHWHGGCRLAHGGGSRDRVTRSADGRYSARNDSTLSLTALRLPSLAESERRSAVSVGKRPQKHSDFGGFLRSEECAAAGQDLAEHDLRDQQVTGRSAHELAVAQASKGLVCLDLTDESIRSRRRIAREQPCRHPEGATRRLNRMRATRHRSPTLRTRAGDRREMHPPACLGQGFGHPPRTGIWDAAPNRRRLIRSNRFYRAHRGPPACHMTHLIQLPSTGCDGGSFPGRPVPNLASPYAVNEECCPSATGAISFGPPSNFRRPVWPSKQPSLSASFGTEIAT